MSRTRYSFSTDALNETEVDLRIDTLIPVSHRMPAGGATKQALVKASGTNRDVEWFTFSSNADLNVTSPSLEDQIRAPSRMATAFAIRDAVAGGITDNYVSTAELAISGQDLTMTLVRAGGLNPLTSTVTLPAGGMGGTDDQTASEVTVTATGFTGNLSATDTDVQTALATIDAFTLGGGGGVALSDDDPVSVGISSNSAGTATDASRRDHRHQVGRASATQFGVSTYATDAEALAGTSTTHAINPVSLAHVLANSGGGTADGVVTGGSVSGTSLTLERSVGADVVITGLPSGGGGTGNTDPVVYRARVAADATDGVQEITLTTALEDGYLLAFDVDSGTGDTLAGRVVIPSTLLRALPAKSTGPQVGDIDDGYSQALTRVTLTSSLSQGLSNFTVWYKDDTHVWILDSRQEIEAVAITGYPMAGGAAGGGGTDTNDYVDAFTASVSGQTLALTLGRTGTLGDLTQSVTLPTGSSADNYVDHLGVTTAGSDLTITLGRTGSLADLQHTVTLPSGGGTTRENVEDWVNELIVPGLGIGKSYDDAAGELTLSAATAPGNDYFFISLNSLSVTPATGTINLTSADYAETTNTIVSFHLFHDFTTHVESQELGMEVNGGTRRAIHRHVNDVLYPLTAGDVIADGLYRFWRRDDDTWIVISSLPQMPDGPPTRRICS